ncbi:hypothetical protein MAPG_10823 [Magnaporthiopsis poae ATCC 64411]|uniref:Integral membrane protein n=1 Tax=Magnaporthiopsis poae (strain ATCC 64411 / 73-15) TaxID=644358 RepID=A0A0C4EDL8_MAGP6|nr:hypothetical protein MAPG_10823 [Magnaporthiopsis poae ATCC 64411]
MGSNDVPPPHVPGYFTAVSARMLEAGGALWTISYLLYLAESRRSKSYGMPLAALALNFGWEVVYAFYVAEAASERAVFTVWCLIDLGLFYGVFRYGPREWARGSGGRSTWVSRNLAWLFGVLVALAIWAHWALAHWWIVNEVGKREGRFYHGRPAADTTELGYWTAGFCQLFLSATSLAQLLVRGHSGGVNWSIWGTRFAGSIIGLWGAYLWLWYYWPEGSPYVPTEMSVFLMVVSIACDLVYAPVLCYVRKTEQVLLDGSKVSGDYDLSAEKSKAA